MTQDTFHVPVLAQSVVDILAAAPAGPLVDGTLGGGGHTQALLLGTDSSRRVIGVDRDPEALEASKLRFSDETRVSLVQGNFGDLSAAVKKIGIAGDHQLAGILLDLGVSSWQLDSADRGFGFKHENAPLDMRMDWIDGAMTAADLIRKSTVEELSRLLRKNGEVRRPHVIAQKMKASLEAGDLQTTRDLADLVEGVLGRRKKGEVHPATTVFQALRIAVNGELEALDRVLETAPRLLKPGGRLVVISYHSLEDRRVKHAFRDGERPKAAPRRLPPPPDWRPTWKVLTRQPLRAAEDEISRNPRARSAKMRAAQRAGLGGNTP